MSDFTHLHVHSHYSLLDGLGKIKPLLETAKASGMDSLALTDHGAMYGVVEFVRSAKEVGVKPIIGCELYLAPKGRDKRRGKVDSASRHLTVLAKDMNGYRNLMKLTTTAHLEGYYYKPRIDYDLLAEHSAGLIVLSGCLNGDISKAIVERREDDAEKLLEWHREVFGKDRFYLEVQEHESIKEQKILNEALISYSKKYNLSLVATADSHYLHPEDSDAQDVLICVQTGKTVSDSDRMSMLGEDYSLKNPAEMKKMWVKHPEAIDNTQKIAEMCNVELEFGVNRLPHFPLPKGKTSEIALREMCEKNLYKIYPKLKQEEAQKRLDYELGVIKKTGYSSYFLIVADFVNEAKNRGILVGPGRGSAAGSIVSFLSNITGLDPLQYDLLFERFLNPERVSMPDIDLDFADDRRDEIIDYVREKYGNDHVAQIITFGTMAARAAVRDSGRALGFPYAFCDSVAKAIPMFTTLTEALDTSKELKEMYNDDPQAKRLIDTAKKLEGVCRHASTHAAGVVVTEEPLIEHVPLQLATTGKDEKQVVTQYAMAEVEALGLLKIDFLGLKNLTIIQNALTRIKQRHDVDIDIDNLPLDDDATYKLLQEGKTTGVFQLESSGMKRYLKELKPTEFEDIISIGALYRPGPMDSIPDFIAAKHGHKKITYLHPILEPILEKTYGVIVTQDQVLQIAREFAGFSYAEADILRKAVGKKIKILLDEQREKFIDGAINNKNIKDLTAKKVWGFIEPFARYGFPRAHAACYAMIAYQTAYLKSKYPADFMASLLTSDEGNTDRQAIEVTEAIAMGLAVLPPDVNESVHDFKVVVQKDKSEAIRFGMSAVKNVGHGPVSALVDERNRAGKYEDLFDMFRRVNSKHFNRKALESLAKAGAMDDFSERNQVVENLDRLLEFNRSLHKKIDVGQTGLFGAEQTVELAAPSIKLDQVIEATREERLSWEKELLGLYLSEHPLSSIRKELENATVQLIELKSLAINSTVRIGGIIDQVKKIFTRNNQQMVFAEIEDMSGSVELVVFPTVYEKSTDTWEEGRQILIEGKLNDKDGELKILVDNVWPLTTDSLKMFTDKNNLNQDLSHIKVDVASELHINLPSSLTKNHMSKLKEFLDENNVNGNDSLSVVITIQQNGSIVHLPAKYSIPRDKALTDSLSKLVGQRSLQLKA